MMSFRMVEQEILENIKIIENQDIITPQQHRLLIGLYKSLRKIRQIIVVSEQKFNRDTQ